VKTRALIMIIIVLIAAVATIAAIQFRAGLSSPSNGDPPGIKVKVKLDHAVGNPRLVQLDDGSYRYVIRMEDGREQSLTPEQFSHQLYLEQSTRNLWFRLMNITTPLGIAWVGVGLLGQVLFTGRMLVQWLVSERKRRSVIPVAFWWMSLLGASMLLAYFLWRKDVVGVLGQATGWFIYMRNLWLIYRRSIRRRITADPAPKPGLPPSLAASDGQAAD
jgi:lipid-A-disaccharide synthase-like uncharacterized protein